MIGLKTDAARQQSGRGRVHEQKLRASCTGKKRARKVAGGGEEDGEWGVEAEAEFTKGEAKVRRLRREPARQRQQPGYVRRKCTFQKSRASWAVMAQRAAREGWRSGGVGGCAGVCARCKRADHAC